MQQQGNDMAPDEAPDETPDEIPGSRRKTPIEQRRERRWKYYVFVFAVVWIVSNLMLRPGSVTYHLTSSRWIIGTILGGLVGGAVFGYIVKTLYSMQRGRKHRRIVRKRAQRPESQ